MRSVLSAPMDAGGTTWGAVKVYSEAPGAYDDRAEGLLARFANQAAIFVGNVHTAESAQRIGDGLRETLHSRDVIATARGMVMARNSSATAPSSVLKAIGCQPSFSNPKATSRTYISDPARGPSVAPANT